MPGLSFLCLSVFSFFFFSLAQFSIQFLLELLCLCLHPPSYFFVLRIALMEVEEKAGSSGSAITSTASAGAPVVNSSEPKIRYTLYLPSSAEEINKKCRQFDVISQAALPPPWAYPPNPQVRCFAFD